MPYLEKTQSKSRWDSETILNAGWFSDQSLCKMSIFICFHVVFICFSCSGPLLPTVPGGSCQGGSWSQGVQGLRGKWRQMGGEAPVENGGNAGKTSVEITTFPHKLWENLEKHTPQLWEIQRYLCFFFPVTLTTIFSFILFVGSATGLGWFIHVTRIFWCGFFNMLKPPNPSIGWCSGCPRSRKFRIIHHFWYYTNQNFTNYMNASLDPVGKLHLFWTCYHWCK